MVFNSAFKGLNIDTLQQLLCTVAGDLQWRCYLSLLEDVDMHDFCDYMLTILNCNNNSAEISFSKLSDIYFFVCALQSK